MRYEIGVCIATGHIVWINGPFPCGTWPDLRIARSWVITELDPQEMIIADGGYNDGGYYFLTPTGGHTPVDYRRSRARARHENINSLFKNWSVLKQVFRHSMFCHYNYTYAVAAIIQFQLWSHTTEGWMVDEEDDVIPLLQLENGDEL